MISAIEIQIVNYLKVNPDKAIELLYEYYYDSLFVVINKITRNKEKSEDALQETFFTVWLKAGCYNVQKSRLFTWLVGIAKNKAIDSIRYYKRKCQDETNTISLNDENKFLQPITDEFNIDVIGLKENIAKITPKYGTVIEAAFLKEYTQQAIAEHINIPLGTVKARVKIGMRELRKIYIN